MAANQIELLSTLADMIKVENKDRAKIINTLQSARILKKNEALTEHYSHLKKVVSASR